MGAVQSEKVAEKGSQGPFLIDPAGIRNRAAASHKAGVDKAAAGQSRDTSSSADARTPQSPVQLLGGASHFRSKLNRQTPELEITLSLRKQRSANCSNRQKIEICKSGNPSSTFTTPPRELLPRSLARCVFLERNKTISNRELLELEIPQLAKNKHRRTALIENFEPNQFSGFQASVAAAFLPIETKGRRAAFSCQLPRQAGESALARGCQ
jgi:hypothetical protein